MKRALPLLALALAMSAQVQAAVPSTIGFSARLVDDKSGDLVTGSHNFKFELYDAATGGTSVWNEARDIAIEEGLLFVDLGEVKAIDGALFNGRKLFLQVAYDEVVMEPRIALGSVPYALRSDAAASADTLGGVLTAEQVQRRITENCQPGNFIAGVNADGTVTCAPDLSGSGDITDVLPGLGMTGGGTSGSVTLGLLPCGPGEVLKSNGTTYACAADANSGGDITGVTVGPAGGLAGGGTSGDVTLTLITTCSPGQLLKWNGSSWGCANDIDTDTNSGGDITAVTTSGSSGLVGGALAGDVALSLLTSCAAGQLLKWNGTAWGCANDIDTNSGGDITDVLAGNGLVGGGTSGSVQLDVVAGPGIVVGADLVSVDTNFLDTRYDARYDPRFVNATGDTMTGALNMNQQRVTNRGCPGGHVRAGPGLCVEDPDASGFTFTGCANRCRAAGSHMCSSGEMRAVMASGVTLSITTLLDWVDDQSVDDQAFFVNANTAENIDGVRATSTSSFCRCCLNVE
ncbi:MAG: hypothetical protein KF773_26085 [Deltaproteobacteria bacterium]|nr:hypothetical protein [Deltaproteobacteria bacterium]MCW5802593.1 hypothetical protein [Deltaproteobacteria bacterium]